VINDDNARLQDPILLLKILMGTRKNFSENYGQFEHALSESFASPALECFALTVCEVFLSVSYQKA
jgi:hypothetical protein